MSGVNISANTLKSVKSWAISLGYVLGPTLIAYNFIHYRVSKSGYYFLTANKYGLTIGVFLLALAMYLRRYSK